MLAIPSVVAEVTNLRPLPLMTKWRLLGTPKTFWRNGLFWEATFRQLAFEEPSLGKKWHNSNYTSIDWVLIGIGIDWNQVSFHGPVGELQRAFSSKRRNILPLLTSNKIFFSPKKIRAGICLLVFTAITQIEFLRDFLIILY